MPKRVLLKAAIVAVLFALLLLPLAMIESLVAERAARRDAAARDVAASSAGRQTFAGLVLSLPYVEEYEERVGEGAEQRLERRRLERTLRYFPAESALAGNVTVSTKHRGLFKVRMFEWRATMQGAFVVDGKQTIARSREASRITFGRPTVALVLSDPRGLVEVPPLTWAGGSVAFERGSGLPGLASGLHAAVPPFDPAQAQRFDYAATLTVRGTEALAIAPIADRNLVSLTSPWPHPSFRGQFLPRPDSQRVDASGFAARWDITSLASSAQQQFEAVLESRKGAGAFEQLEVAFIDPIDIYSLSDRASKYGFLFVGLTFGCFLLYEVLRRWRIHPAQYGLVGLALATFFLLLFALSEHIAFGLSYLIASSACIALLGFYLSAVLQSARRGGAFALLLTALYASLYGLLVSEDNALLLGALLVFGALAAAMIATRKLDWYALDGPVDAKA